MLDTMQQDYPLECEPGVIRLFGAADIRSRGMVSGWSGPEEGHTWNDGIEAVYSIIMRSPVRRLGLIVMGEPYVTRIRPVQELTLYGNGYRIAFWRMTGRTETVLTAALEPEWWFVRDGHAAMTLMFHMPNSVRPKDLNDGQDGREIGFCFRSICLRPLPA